MEEIVTELPIKWERWLWRLMEAVVVVVVAAAAVVVVVLGFNFLSSSDCKLEPVNKRRCFCILFFLNKKKVWFSQK